MNPAPSTNANMEDGSLAQYELLRTGVVEGAGTANLVGLVQVRTLGIVAWLHHRAAQRPPHETPLLPVHRRGARASVRSASGGVLEPGLIRVLANMALGGLGGIHS
jgi:hypothetical protein